MQERRNSIAKSLELRLACINPSICYIYVICIYVMTVNVRSTTDAIFIVQQLQEKFYAANKTLYMAFVDLEKAFDPVYRQMCHLGGVSKTCMSS